MVKFVIFLVFLRVISSEPLCIENKNNCKKCDSLTNLCMKCESDYFTPDNNGGCEVKKLCKMGKNYCEECNVDENFCEVCSEGYYPDNIGGCSYTENCEISNYGECIKCTNNFILIGQENSIKICKAINSEDFLHCKEIDYLRGYCKTCEENYFLNKGDKKCIETENCSSSIYGHCILCNSGYYLDLNDRQCKSSNKDDAFLSCIESEDGKKCSKCQDYYYLGEDSKCINVNFCAESERYKCKKCIEGYYLSGDGNTCALDKNCYISNKDSGLCTWCISNYYVDINSGKCKSNQGDDDLKYCRYFSDKCISCELNYQVGEDGKCSSTYNCAKSELGICNKCSEGYYLGLDSFCSNVEHCIYSDKYNGCKECEDNYYYDKYNSTCKESLNKTFLNCKSSNYNGLLCGECKDDYYLLNSDNLCYSNTKKDNYYKCAIVDSKSSECTKCISGYYLGEIDKKCTKVEYCAKSEDNKCIECKDNFCLDLKKGTCEFNLYIENEESKIYYKCNKTNEEGTACEYCQTGYTLGKNGICIDILNCEEEKDDICLRCKNDEINDLYYCVNKDFGCKKTNFKNCLKCDGFGLILKCTECKEGYELDEYNRCI